MALVRLGKPVPEVAQELGIGTSVLYRWTDELRRLRQENAHLLMENDI